eukprot:g9220.t1
MFRVFRALCSFPSKAITNQILLNNFKARTLDSSPDIASASLISFFLSPSLSRNDSFGRLCSNNAKDSKPEVKSKDSESSNRPLMNEDMKELHKSSTGNSKSNGDSSSTIDHHAKRQIRELTDILQGRVRDENPKQSEKSGGESQEGGVTSLMSLLMQPMKFLEQAYNWFYGRIIYNYIDIDFDVYEFLEGAKDAYYMVNHLFGEGDFETLKPMVSSKLLENFKAVSDEFKDKGMVMSISTEEIKGANIAGVRVVNALSLTRYGPEFEIPPMTDDKKNFWFMIYVRFSSFHRFKLLQPGGTIVSDSSSYRRDLWTFVRGPINVLPVKESSPGWILLTIA